MIDLGPKPLYDWFKMLSPTDVVLTASFTDEEFDKLCMLLRKWDSDRLTAKVLQDMKDNPGKFIP